MIENYNSQRPLKECIHAAKFHDTRSQVNNESAVALSEAYPNYQEGILNVNISCHLVPIIIQ
jgi:hypothetical protein